jgi:hypothetical protein
LSVKKLVCVVILVYAPRTTTVHQMAYHSASAIAAAIMLYTRPIRRAEYIMTLNHKIALDPTVKQERYFRRATGIGGRCSGQGKTDTE